MRFLSNQVFFQIWIVSVLVISTVGGILVYQYKTEDKKLKPSAEIIGQEDINGPEQDTKEITQEAKELPSADESGIAEEIMPKPKEDIKDEKEYTEDKGEGLNLTTTKLAVIPEGAVDVFDILSGKDNACDGGICDAVSIPSFSPDGRKVAYVHLTGTIEDQKYFVVVNNEEGEKYDEISSLASVFTSPILFSFDSSKIAYKAKKDGKEFVVVNDEEGKQYDEVSLPVFSPDSSKVAYRAENNGKEFVVVDGKERKEYYKVSVPVFSPDSKKIAHWAMTEQDGKEFVVVDGKEGKKYYEVRGIKFSPDNSKVSYVVYQSMESDEYPFVVVNGEERKSYDHISSFSIFSPDSEKIAYSAKKDGKEFVVVNNEEGEKYDKVSSLKFSSDSEKVFYMAENDEKMFIVINNKEEKAYYRVTRNSLAVSPDNSKIVYTAREDMVKEGGEIDRKWFVVVNNEEKEMQDYAYSSFIFSPDSSKIASCGVNYDKDGKYIVAKYLVAINNKEGKKYDYISSLIFSQDGEYICYGARINNELWWIADKVEGYND